MSILGLLCEYDSGMYQLLEKSGRISMVAKKKFLAGELVFREPISLETKLARINCSENRKLADKYGIERMFFALYESFLKLNISMQRDIFSLSTPMNSNIAAEFRRKCKIYGKDKRWYDEKIEQFARLCIVFKFHGFNSQDSDASIAVKSSKLRHSCIPNCNITFAQTFNSLAQCYVLRPIEIGEEMCICFEETNVNKPTIMRRRTLLQSKEFLCKCPRCMAPGDDTRQFPCENSSCNGRHYVCQPTDADEPHVLPCIACQKIATPEYAESMLALEAMMFHINDNLQLASKNGDPVGGFKAMLGSPESLRNVLNLRQFAPKCHAGTWGVNVGAYYYMRDILSASDKLQLAHDMVAPLKHMTIYPTEILVNLYNMATELFIDIDTEESLFLASAYTRVQLQMELVRSNRDITRCLVPVLSTIDAKLLKILKKLPEENPTRQLCNWCGVEPSCTAVTLSLCGRCNRAAYCTKDCQKLHWKLHKTSCAGGSGRTDDK